MTVSLPTGIYPNSFSPRLIDFGFMLRPSGGASVLRIDRPGSRFAVDLTFPALSPTKGNALAATLLRARSRGLEVKIPLLNRSQGSPGSPVVNGAGQTGTSINLRGLTAGYVCRAGYWLTLVDGNGGKYLHMVTIEGTANGSGQVSIGIEPPIRAAFGDGAQVVLDAPVITGFLSSDTAWDMLLGDLTAGFGCTLEEAA